MDRIHVVLIVAALITGAGNTLGFTLQNKQPVIQNGIQKHFFHPYMQVSLRFVSNSFSLIAYLIHKYRNKITQQPVQGNVAQENIKAPLVLFLVPTFLDYLAVICYYTALNFIPGSVYQILRGGTILTTFLFSYTCLKTRPTRAKIIGCTTALIGLITVGLVNFLMSTQSNEQKQQTLIGYGLILIALFGNGLHFVYEQHLILKYKAQPLQIVGMQGIFGILISLIFIPALSYIPCKLRNQFCIIQQSGDSVVENVNVYLRQVFNDELILTGVFIVLVSMSVYNTLGVVIAKQMNSLTRAICDASRTVIIWIIGIILTASLGSDDKRFRWESLNQWQILGESLGFLILIIGNLIYYDLIKVFHKQIKKQTLIEEQNQTTIIQEKY